jgi:hypothetical protein
MQHKRALYWSGSIGLLVLVALLVLYKSWQPRAIDQLHAIAATHVIPDEENAAIEYARIETTYDSIDLPFPSSDDPNEEDALAFDHARDFTTRMRPWRTVEYPAVADGPNW